MYTIAIVLAQGVHLNRDKHKTAPRQDVLITQVIRLYTKCYAWRGGLGTRLL